MGFPRKCNLNSLGVCLLQRVELLNSSLRYSASLIHIPNLSGEPTTPNLVMHRSHP